jgi:iron(III)-salmochelin esterase
MHIARGSSFPSMQKSAYPARTKPGHGASILLAVLVSVLSAWFQGCVPTGQAPGDASAPPTEVSRGGERADRSAGPVKGNPSPVKASSPTLGREADEDTKGNTARSPENSPVPVTSTPKTKQAGVGVEKLSGYQVPAESLSIPSSRYPDATVAVMLPSDYDRQPNRKYPLVIAFGGAGECAKPPEQGSLAWLRYYKTDEAARAAESGTLRVSHFRGLVTERQLKEFNSLLKHRPYTGVILACPSSPPLWGLRGGVDFPEYESFVMRELIPELQRRYRTDPDMIGIDGVSMGGARSLYYGLKYPEVFSSIGAVQGAFGPYVDTYRQLIKDNKEALAHRSIQLITSDGDAMLRSVELMHKIMRDEKIPHRFTVLTGPHDYVFNQGPGALSLLLFHHDALSSAAGDQAE